MGTTKGRKHFGEAIIEEVLKQKSEGKTNREISEHFGFPSKHIIKSLIKRFNKRQRQITLGITPRKKGRPRKSELLAEDYKDNIIKHLKMENELLRSFLSEPGRRLKRQLNIE